MSTNPPDGLDDGAVSTPDAEDHDGVLDTVTAALGGLSAIDLHGTPKVTVAAARWADAVAAARDDLGLGYFDFLSAIDWSNDVSVGDPPAEPVDERYEVLCVVGDGTGDRLVILSADLPKDAPTIASVTHLFPGAQWHEREAREMFGIDFSGLDKTDHLYLPEEFEGHPLRKSFALLSREVKPWPGDVDVEGIPGRGGPSTENPEA